MKATTYIINYQPYPARAEHCAVGVLVFDSSGKVRVHLATNLRKLKALDPQSSIEILRDSLGWLVDEVNKTNGAWSAFQHGISSLRFSKEPGFFQYESNLDYDKQVKWLLAVSAEPRSAKPGEIPLLPPQSWAWRKRMKVTRPSTPLRMISLAFSTNRFARR